MEPYFRNILNMQAAVRRFRNIHRKTSVLELFF